MAATEAVREFVWPGMMPTLLASCVKVPGSEPPHSGPQRREWTTQTADWPGAVEPRLPQAPTISLHNLVTRQLHLQLATPAPQLHV